jgi:hypothetical protein
VVALCTSVGGLVLGPAPAAGLYCAYRERQIEKVVKKEKAVALEKHE